MTLMRCDDRTRTYVERRRAEGRTIREIRSCLKRYIARDICRGRPDTLHGPTV